MCLYVSFISISIASWVSSCEDLLSKASCRILFQKGNESEVNIIGIQKQTHKYHSCQFGDEGTCDTLFIILKLGLMVSSPYGQDSILVTDL